MGFIVGWLLGLLIAWPMLGVMRRLEARRNKRRPKARYPGDTLLTLRIG